MVGGGNFVNLTFAPILRHTANKNKNILTCPCSSTGSDDMRAPEITHYHTPGRGVFRPILSVDYPTWPSYKSIYDDPVHPTDRINTPGYRYLPISRDTYGISPRNIYPHNYHSDRYPTYGTY